MNPKKEHQKVLADQLIKNLAKRNMEGFYCTSADQACKLASSMIEPGSSVSWGGTMTMGEIGLDKMIAERTDLVVYDRSKAGSQEEVDEIYRKAFSVDNYIMSANAISLDGQLVNIDGTGNRVAALIFGPKQVIVIAGMNKVCPDLETAMVRARNLASPPNAMRFGKKTPCTATGKCGDCLSPDCICNQIVITRNSRDTGRIKVILVEGEWGY